MDACKKNILAYQVSDTRSVGPCILAMRMAFEKFKIFPGKALKFIADGYSAYLLASQQCKLSNGWDFDVTQVIGLTNDDAVSTEFRWVKQVVERLNRTLEPSSLPTGLLVVTEVRMVLIMALLFGLPTITFCVLILITIGSL